MTRRFRESGEETVEERAYRLANVTLASWVAQGGGPNVDGLDLVEFFVAGFLARDQDKVALPPPAQGELPLGKRRGRR